MSEREQTFTQINEKALRAYESSEGTAALVRRSRASGGGITVGNLETTASGVHNVIFVQDGKELMHPDVPESLLADEHQERLAAELAGRALRPEGHSPERAKAVETRLDEIRKGLSDEEMTAFHTYATAKQPHEFSVALDAIGAGKRELAVEYRSLSEEFQNLR